MNDIYPQGNRKLSYNVIRSRLGTYDSMKHLGEMQKYLSGRCSYEDMKYTETREMSKTLIQNRQSSTGGGVGGSEAPQTAKECEGRGQVLRGSSQSRSQGKQC